MQHRKNRRDTSSREHDIIHTFPMAFNRAERRAAGYRGGVPQYLDAMRFAIQRAPRRARRAFDRAFPV